MAGGLIIERGTSGFACKMAAIDPSQRQRNDFVTRLSPTLSLSLPPPCSIRSPIRLSFSLIPFACSFARSSFSFAFPRQLDLVFLSVNLAVSFTRPLFPTVRRLVHDLVLFSLKLRALSAPSRFERATPRTARYDGGNSVATLFPARERGNQFGIEKKTRYFR